MARTSEHPKTHSPKGRASAMTPAPVKVSVGSTVHEVKGVRSGTLNEIVKTVKRGAQTAHRNGGAEVTLRFVDGVVLISEELEELLDHADRIAVLFAGRIAGILPAASADPERLGLLMSGP